MRLVGMLFVLFAASCSDSPTTLTRGGLHSSSSGGSTGTTAGGAAGTSSSGDDAPTDNANPDPVTSGGSAAQTCVDTINGYRKQQGLPPLERWTAAESCSDQEATSDGASSSAHGAFGKCGELSQNECPGWPGPAETMIPQCLKAMWDQGPGEGHHDNMASKQWKRVACGFGNGRGGVWSVQNFQ